MADDSEFLIAFPILLAFLGLILVILVSLSRKLEKVALEMEGVVVTVLTVANLAVSIKYGLPFNKGHSRAYCSYLAEYFYRRTCTHPSLFGEACAQLSRGWAHITSSREVS